MKIKIEYYQHQQIKFIFIFLLIAYASPSANIYMKEHPHSSINNLVEHLQNIYTVKRKDHSGDDHKLSDKYNTSYNQPKVKSHSENTRLQTTGNNYSSTKDSLNFLSNDRQQQQLKQELSKVYRHPWRSNGVFHEHDNEVKRLPAGDLDSWQIYRMNMAKRSYQCPKNYKGMKIPSIGKQFIKYDCKDKDGHIPYLYESDLHKIEKIREKIYSKPFKRTNTVRHQLFGIAQKKPQQRPVSLVNFEHQQKLKKLHLPLQSKLSKLTQ